MQCCHTGYASVSQMPVSGPKVGWWAKSSGSQLINQRLVFKTRKACCSQGWRREGGVTSCNPFIEVYRVTQWKSGWKIALLKTDHQFDAQLLELP